MNQTHDGVRQATVRVAGRAVEHRQPGWAAPAGAVLLLIGLLGPGAGGVRGQAAGTAAVTPEPAGSQDCLRCHSLPNLGYRETASGPARTFSVSPAGFHSSAHGKLSCRQCHSDIAAYPHPDPARRRRVTCDQDCHAVDSAGRPYTHQAIVAEFRQSVHGRPADAGQAAGPADPDAPTCLTCHGHGDAHAIVSPAQLTRPEKMALCVDCHDDRALMAKHDVPVDAVASYRRSFHYKAIRFGGPKTAICIDCHTAHHVLPPSDPRSSVAPAALTKTCGQAGCHRGAGRNFAVSGANHLDLRVSQVPVLWYEEKFFLVLTAGTMLMLLVGIVLDVQRKFGWVALLRRLARALARGFGRLRPSLARSGRRGLRAARRILID